MRAVGALFAIWAGYIVWDWFDPLGYFDLTGLYAAIASISLYPAIEGWRHSALPFPTLDRRAVCRALRRVAIRRLAPPP